MSLNKCHLFDLNTSTAHSLMVTTWSISDKKKIAAEFVCEKCLSFFTREVINSFLIEKEELIEQQKYMKREELLDRISASRQKLEDFKNSSDIS